MKLRRWLLLFCALILMADGVSAQEIVVINSPIQDDTKKAELTAAEKNLMNRIALPRVRKQLAGQEFCEESFDPAAVIHGSFSRAGAQQTIIFYQYCQTGNGLGEVGLVLIENNKMIGNYIADIGWSVDAKVLPDINQNGLDEFVLYYSGGIHQGAGGTGADIMEFSASGPKGIGWFQAENFSEDDNNFSYKVSAKPGTAPIFYREKYASTSTGKFRRIGRQAAFKLGKTVGKFEAVR
jgi:hypothetical protein